LAKGWPAEGVSDNLSDRYRNHVLKNLITTFNTSVKVMGKGFLIKDQKLGT